MKNLISFDTSKLLKDAGFNGYTKYKYSINGNIYSSESILDNHVGIYPILNQTALQKWLREVHNYHIVIDRSSKYFVISRICIWNSKLNENREIELSGLDFKDFSTYEEALENSLKFTLKNLILIRTLNSLIKIEKNSTYGIDCPETFEAYNKEKSVIIAKLGTLYTKWLKNKLKDI